MLLQLIYITERTNNSYDRYIEKEKGCRNEQIQKFDIQLGKKYIGFKQIFGKVCYTLVLRKSKFNINMEANPYK